MIAVSLPESDVLAGDLLFYCICSLESAKNVPAINNEKMIYYRLVEKSPAGK